jgi:hypothetical protein
LALLAYLAPESNIVGGKISEPSTAETSKLNQGCFECYQIVRKSPQLCYSFLKI